MTNYILEMSPKGYDAIITHLISSTSIKEQAAFAFAVPDYKYNVLSLKVIKWELMHHHSFNNQTEFNLELTDKKQAQLIKRAHNLNAALVELHSHPFSVSAIFSHSDITGFKEFVPHVMWRLKGRPYTAVIVTPYAFDALIWVENPKIPHTLTCIKIGSKEIYPSRLTCYEEIIE